VLAFPEWQTIFDWHHTGGNISQQAMQFDLGAQGPASPNCWSGFAPWPDGQPHIVISINGGNSDDTQWSSGPTSDATCLRFAGPVFVPGHLYRVAMKITWGDHRTGAMAVWFDGTKYADVTGIDDMVYSASTGQQWGVYPKFAHYRKYNTSYPATDVWFSGLVRGSTLADVTLP
jgi:hypothetical protein